MADALIKIFTWVGMLSIASTALLIGVTGWIYLLKKLKEKPD